MCAVKAAKLSCHFPQTSLVQNSSRKIGLLKQRKLSAPRVAFKKEENEINEVNLLFQITLTSF